MFALALFAAANDSCHYMRTTYALEQLSKPSQPSGPVVDPMTAEAAAELDARFTANARKQIALRGFGGLFADQIGISTISDEGDSGALVLDEAAAAAGLHIGSYNGTSICTPIRRGQQSRSKNCDSTCATIATVALRCAELRTPSSVSACRPRPPAAADAATAHRT
jgi:hypothetical protein